MLTVKMTPWWNAQAPKMLDIFCHHYQVILLFLIRLSSESLVILYEWSEQSKDSEGKGIKKDTYNFLTWTYIDGRACIFVAPTTMKSWLFYIMQTFDLRPSWGPKGPPKIGGLRKFWILYIWHKIDPPKIKF
jgi:hypothetical protein